jgi:hypothetical protein
LVCPLKHHDLERSSYYSYGYTAMIFDIQSQLNGFASVKVRSAQSKLYAVSRHA